MTSDYDRYVRAEWERFSASPERSQAARGLLQDVSTARVLDVGCGAGQELLPFVRDGAYGIGIDFAEEAGQAGTELFRREGIGTRVLFMRARAEAIPCGSEFFDLLICRLALPYTDNARALAEFERVVKPGGLIVLKIHHARYYLNKAAAAIGDRDLRSFVHAARVLLAGALYHLSGHQPRNGVVGSETFQTERLLRRELATLGLHVEAMLPDTTPQAPSFLLRKGG